VPFVRGIALEGRHLAIKWRKWNNILHRDIGYFFFGMTVIYAISGVALNHIVDWNPSYSVTRAEVQWPGEPGRETVTREAALAFLDQYGERDNYKKHYYPEPGYLKIFLKGGSVEIDLNTGRGILEKLDKRPLFFEVNYLHYNPNRLWTWFSDIYCLGLFILAITGLFVLKGRKGITGRGAWFTSVGVLIPILFLLFYL
jgi:hypothetical protein